MTQSILDSLELAAGPDPRTADRAHGAPSTGQPLHWSYRAVAGGCLGLVGGAINAVLLAQSLPIDVTGVLLVCGVLPGVSAALAVGRAEALLPRAATAAVAGALAVDLVFLLNLVVLGGSVSQFNRHLPFWLGPGDENIMMGEAFIAGLALGVVPAILASRGESWLHALRRR